MSRAGSIIAATAFVIAFALGLSAFAHVGASTHAKVRHSANTAAPTASGSIFNPHSWPLPSDLRVNTPPAGSASVLTESTVAAQLQAQVTASQGQLATLDLVQATVADYAPPPDHAVFSRVVWLATILNSHEAAHRKYDSAVCKPGCPAAHVIANRFVLIDPTSGEILVSLGVPVSN